MPTPTAYPPEPSLDAIDGRATFDGHVVRLERWGRGADRRRCAYAAAPIRCVRGAQVMATPDAAFLVLDVALSDGRPSGVPTRPWALARSVWTLRVPDPDKAARFAAMVARHAPAEAEPLERMPRTDRRPVGLIAVAAMLAAALAVLGGWTVYRSAQPEPVKTRIIRRTVVKERTRTVTSCPYGQTAGETPQAQATQPQIQSETNTQEAAPQTQTTQPEARTPQADTQTRQGETRTHNGGQENTQEDTDVQ